MGKLSALLWGTAIGAGLMYFMDPQNGDRRKAMVRDQVNHLQNMTNDGFQTGVNDLRNRVQGLMSEGMAMVGSENVSDHVVEQRVRARLGFLSRHPGAIQVNVQNHRAILSGDVLANEADQLVNGVEHVRGVSGVENNLRVHQNADNIPQLQGEGWMPGQNGSQWSPSTRLLASAGALYLFLSGMFRGGFVGTLSQLGGIVLGTRAITNLNMRQMTGMGESEAAIRVRKTISIDAPVDRVYDLWSNFENFPKFMENVDTIKNMGNNKSHWVVKGPAGTKVEFDAVITEKEPDKLIAWKTTPNSEVKHEGQVRFQETGQNGTRINVQMAYTPPAGVAGAAVASLFGKDPKSEMDHDLIRMKSLLEEGKTTAGSQTVTRNQVMPVTGQGNAQQGSRGKGNTRTGGGGGSAETDTDTNTDEGAPLAPPGI